MNRRSTILRRPRPGLATLAACAVSAMLAPPAPASMILALDLPALVERADAIAVVDVVSARAGWDAAHERIVSTVELTVVESWKGAPAPAARVTVVQSGGTVGDVTMVVSGMPRFSPGERALVFLHGPPERASVVGMAQGKRVVRPDPAGGGRWVVDAPARAGASFVGAGAPALEPRTPRPLDDVRAQLRALVSKAGVR